MSNKNLCKTCIHGQNDAGYCAIDPKHYIVDEPACACVDYNSALDKIIREEVYKTLKYVSLNAEELTDRALEHQTYKLINLLKFKEAI